MDERERKKENYPDAKEKQTMDTQKMIRISFKTRRWQNSETALFTKITFYKLFQDVGDHGSS